MNTASLFPGTNGKTRLALAFVVPLVSALAGAGGHSLVASVVESKTLPVRVNALEKELAEHGRRPHDAAAAGLARNSGGIAANSAAVQVAQAELDAHLEEARRWRAELREDMQEIKAMLRRALR